MRALPWLEHRARSHRPTPVLKHPPHPRRSAVTKRLRLHLRQPTAPKLLLRRRRPADARNPRHRRHRLPAPKPRLHVRKRAGTRNVRRRRHQAQVRRHQPRPRQVTLAKKQARNPQLRRQRQRLQPTRSRRSDHYLSRNRRLVRQQRPPVTPPKPMLPLPQAAVMDWYG